MPKKENSGKTLRVTWVKSDIGFPKDQKAQYEAHLLYGRVDDLWPSL